MGTPPNTTRHRGSRSRILRDPRATRPVHDALENLRNPYRTTDLPKVVEESATETGERVDVLANLLAVITKSHTITPRGSTHVQRIDFDEDVVRLYVHSADRLMANLREFTEKLKGACPDEVPSSEVRKNWAAILDRVHADDETVYVTQHGRRVAAVVPPYVAESYTADQAWFNTSEWQEKEREADEDISAGRVTRFESDEAFLDSLTDGDEEEAE